MSILQGALLGLVQGLAEFLPISSSGHLNLIQALFQLDLTHQLLFNILLHVGSLVAVLLVFWRDWWEMLRHPIRNRTLLLLVVASLPALAAKLVLGDTLDVLETSNALLGVSFLFTGLLLILTQAIGQRNERLQLAGEKVGVFHALAMGLMQVIGMLPGVSRSGSTIFGGVGAKLSRASAAKFSFMMSMPAIVASFLSEGYSAYKSGALSQSGDWAAIVVGMVVAGVSGYLAIRFMLRIIAKVSLNWFALYVIVLGIVVLALQATGVIDGAPLHLLPQATAVPLP
ncbi:MAG: undecaprenyl-diphosphate phosphatase [Candidatus Limiplasma sp.]|nr:undecaprenyl-diphosphate phosphatase [Candidatus Limiplasma sp.]MEA5145852.1 undecaprenyl-diphosphate phosphatase [Candidatus Limiplasma sp.]